MALISAQPGGKNGDPEKNPHPEITTDGPDPETRLAELKADRAALLRRDFATEREMFAGLIPEGFSVPLKRPAHPDKPETHEDPKKALASNMTPALTPEAQQKEAAPEGQNPANANGAVPLEKPDENSGKRSV